MSTALPTRGSIRRLVRLIVLALVATTLSLGAGAASTATAASPQAKPPTPRPDHHIRGIDPDAPADAVIQGLVYDQDGLPLDNIQVEAFSSADPGADPVASDLTYEYEDSASHGAYELHVPAGEYLVRFSSPDFARTVYETVFHGGGAGTPVTVAAAATVALPDAVLSPETGATVTGTVLDGEGNPLAAADVTLVRTYADGDYSYLDDAQTDANGRYTFDGVNRDRAHTVVARYYWEDDDSWIFLPATFLGQAPVAELADRFTVPETPVLAPITLRAGVPVTGHVTGPTGQPMRYAEVLSLAVGPDGELYGAEWTETDDDGSFTELLVSGATYTIGIPGNRGNDTTYLGDVTDPSNARPFTLGATAYDVGTIQAGVTGSVVRVSVVDADHDPADEHEVRVWRKAGDHFTRIGWANQKAPGTYQRRLDWGHQYTFEVVTHDESDDQIGYFLGGATNVEGAQLVTPTEAHPTLDAGTITLPGAVPGKLRGTVEAGGEPLADAGVALYGRVASCDEDDCWDWVDDTTTSATGTYQLRIRPWMRDDYATFTVAAELEALGYGAVFAGGSGEVHEATTYAAPEDGTTTVVDTITLTAAPYTVQGTIEVDGGEFGDDAEAHATLYCWADDGEYGYWDDVDMTWTESSRYAFQVDKPYDACLVDVSYYGPGTDGSWSGSSVSGPWPTVDVTSTPGVFAVTEEVATAPAVTVRPPSTVSGSITAFDGAVLAGDYSVQLYRWDEEEEYWQGRHSTYTEDPSYSFRDLEPGTYATRVSYYAYVGTESPYAVSWSGPGGQPAGPGAPGTVTVTEEPSAQTLDVVLRDKPRVRGTVVDASGPVAGATVKLYGFWCPGCAELAATTVSDADGRYSFPTTDLHWFSGVTVKATKPSAGYAATWLGGGSEADSATTVRVIDDGSDTELEPLTLALRPGTVVGDLTTSDGGSLTDSTTQVDLYRWDADSASFTPLTDSTTDDTEAFTFSGLEPGTYTVSATNTPHDGVSRYATSFYGGALASSPADADKVFTIGATNPTRITLELDRGVGLSGVVSTPYGEKKLPIDGAQIYISAVSDEAGWLTVAAHSDTDGRYEVRLPSDSRVTAVNSYAAGFEGFSASSHPALIDMAGSDQSYGISLDPDWGDIGTVAGERNPSCLTQGSSQIDFDGRLLQTGDGVVFDDDAYYSENPLTAANTTAVLAPLSGGEHYTAPTWGIADGTLCVQWGSRFDGYPVFQMMMTPAAGGGYDVVYNYDKIETSPPSSRAGYADGLRSFGESVLFPGAGNGYGDAADTALTKHSLGSDVLGRYEFHFDGFEELAEAPYGWSGTIKGTRSVGETLTASPGQWYFDDADEPIDPDDIEFRYTWARGTKTLGTGATYLVQSSDFGRNVRLYIDAKVDGHAIGSRSVRVKITNGSAAAANATRPSLAPDNPAIGATLTLDPGTWTPTEGLTEADLSYEYEWYRNGNRIRDAVGTTYLVTDADAGRDITAAVLVDAPGRGQVRAVTDAVTVAQRPRLVAQSRPAITGATKVGQTLTVDPGTWGEEGPLAGLVGGSPSVAGGLSYDYTWHVGWRQRSADAGSGGAAYTLTAADLHQTVTVTVTARGAGYRDGDASSTVGPVLAADATTRTLSIHVVDATDATPVSGAYVYACEYVDWTCLPAGTTDASGDYSALALAERDYSVSVYPEAPYRSASRDVRVADGADVTIELTKPAPPPANVEIPTSNGTYDGLPVVYWQRDQDFNVSGCATTPSPTYTVKFTDGTPDRTGALTKGAEAGGIATFHATIPAFYPSHGDTTIETTVPADCEEGTAPTKITIYIDPSGIVTDQYGRPIEGAAVTLLRSDHAGGPFTQVPDGSEVMSPDNRDNPSLTDDTGFFRWDVEEGWYRVKAEATGCTTSTTDAMQVPPIRVDLLIRLQCAGATAPSATPTIAGTPSVGETLSTDPDVWADPLDDVTIRWLRDGAAIEGADDETYEVTGADNGHLISVEHTAKRPTYTQEEGHGAPVSFTTVTATSATKRVAGLAAPVANTSPAITGLPAKVGGTLSSTAPIWSLDGVVSTLEWYVGGVGTGVTGNSFPLGADHAGAVITVRYVGRLDGHTDGVATSGPVTVAKGDAPTASAKPTISGAPKVGQTLTAAPGTWSAPRLAFGYQWKRAGAAIAGATASTYAVTVADLGAAVTVTVVATRPGYQSGTADSASVTVVKHTSAVTVAAPKKAVAGKKATITGAVAVAGVSGPLGTVTLLDGKKKVGSTVLKATAKGKVSFVLKRLKAGTHKLKLVYGGAAHTTGATSKVVKLKVTKPKKGKHRIALPGLPSLF